MRAVDHDGHLLTLLGERLLGRSDVLLIVIGTLGAATQDDEAVLVAGGTGDGGKALLGDTHEVVLGGGGANGIDGDAEVTIGAVLEADGEGKTRGELTVQLGLGGAGANGADGDEVREELGRDRIEHLSGNRNAGVGQIAEHLAG